MSLVFIMGYKKIYVQYLSNMAEVLLHQFSVEKKSPSIERETTDNCSEQRSVQSNIWWLLVNAWQKTQEQSKHVVLLLLCNHSVYQIYSVYSILCSSEDVSIVFNSRFFPMNFFQSVFNPFSIQYMFWKTILRLLYMLFQEVTPFFVLNMSFGTVICIYVLEKRAFIPSS